MHHTFKPNHVIKGIQDLIVSQNPLYNSGKKDCLVFRYMPSLNHDFKI